VMMAFLTDATTNAHRVNRALSGSYTADSLITFSFYVAKPAASDIRGIIARVRTSVGGQAVNITVSDDGANSTYSFANSTPFGTNPPAAITAANFSTVNVGNNWTRISITTAVASANTTYTQWDIGFSTNINSDLGAGTANSQLFIDAVQLEAGSFPTSYIPTTTATATRAADVSTSTSGSNFSSWYRQDEGTVFSDTFSPVDSISGLFNHDYTIHDGTGNEVIRVVSSAGYGATGHNVSVWDNGTAQFTNVIGSKGIFNKIAIGYKTDNTSAAGNGNLVNTDTSCTMPTVSLLSLGGSHASGNTKLTQIKRFTYWPTRLSNDTLQTITA